MALRKIGKTPTPTPTPAASDKKVTRVTAPADAKVKAPKEKAPKVSKAVRNVSKDEFLGRRMRVGEYQDYTLSLNAKVSAKDRLTDEELCANWQAQFPNAVRFTPFHVKGVRRDYNAGRHSKPFPGKKTGDDVSIPYMKNKDGQRVPAALVSATAAKPTKTKATADAPIETPKAIKKIAKKVTAPAAAA